MWLREATRLYRAFQRPATPGVIELKLEDLSICVADARANRTPTSKRFMDDADLDDIARWARGLRNPGCLVLGQLLFARKAGTFSKHMDLGLPDFDQYAGLLDALSGSGQSIVILTGDVHFGRVAVCELLNGKQIVEVVASPMALVAPVPPNEWKSAPQAFPDWPTPGRVQRPISTDPATSSTATTSRRSSSAAWEARSTCVSRRGPPTTREGFPHRPAPMSTGCPDDAACPTIH